MQAGDSLAILACMDKHSRILKQTADEVGHSVQLDTQDADILGHGKVEHLWRLLPTNPIEVHEFLLWHQSCDRQWFETPEEAAAQYRTKWAEWQDAQAPEVDYNADAIDFTP